MTHKPSGIRLDQSDCRRSAHRSEGQTERTVPLRLRAEVQAVLRRGDWGLKDSRAATRAAGRQRSRHESRGVGEPASLKAERSMPVRLGKRNTRNAAAGDA